MSFVGGQVFTICSGYSKAKRAQCVLGAVDGWRLTEPGAFWVLWWLGAGGIAEITWRSN